MATPGLTKRGMTPLVQGQTSGYLTQTHNVWFAKVDNWEQWETPNLLLQNFFRKKSHFYAKV